MTNKGRAPALLPHHVDDVFSHSCGNRHLERLLLPPPLLLHQPPRKRCSRVYAVRVALVPLIIVPGSISIIVNISSIIVEPFDSGVRWQRVDNFRSRCEERCDAACCPSVSVLAAVNFSFGKGGR
jgi:hypothetical protein